MKLDRNQLFSVIKNELDGMGLPTSSAVIEPLLDAFLAADNESLDLDNVDSEFVSWYASSPYCTAGNLTVKKSRTVNTGHGSVTVGYEMTVKSQGAALWALKVIDEWIGAALIQDEGNTRHVDSIAAVQTSNAIQTATFIVTEIRVNSLDGKRSVKLAGGVYDKFGITLYPDCETLLKNQKLSDWYDGLAYGKHPVKLRAVAEMDASGKPRRIISFEKLG